MDNQIWYEQYQEDEKEEKKLKKQARHTAIFDGPGPADKLYKKKKIKVIKKGLRRTL